MEWSTSAFGGNAGPQVCAEWPSIEYEVVGVFRSDGSVDVAETARWGSGSSSRIRLEFSDPFRGGDGRIQYYDGNHVSWWDPMRDGLQY